MEQATSVNVPFTVANVMKCVCTKCPVQTGSQCVRAQMAEMKAALMKSTLERQDIPGLYCSTDTATCQDIDTSQPCICGSCPVFGKYELATRQPMGYYCRDGLAR
jgi:hypothetical protein